MRYKGDDNRAAASKSSNRREKALRSSRSPSECTEEIDIDVADGVISLRSFRKLVAIVLRLHSTR